MAADYEVNIKLNTKQLKTQLDVLDNKIANLGRGTGGKGRGKGQNSFAQQNHHVKSLLNFENRKLDLQIKNRAIRTDLIKLEEKGVKTELLRKDLGKLANLQSQHTKKATIETYGFAKLQARQTQFDVKKQKEKTAQLKRQNIEFQKQSRAIQSISKRSPVGGTRYQFGSPAQLKYSGGPSSPIMGAPGIMGSPRGQIRGMRNPAIQSAIISGAFPLLFGQGPATALAGAAGGFAGQKFGGQMGGFAGGLAATAAVSAIGQYIGSVQKLGQALNENTKDVGALSAALGITGTEFEKNLKTLEKLGGEEAAFEAARKKMIGLVGQEGVDALTKFGKGTTELANQFTIAMTQMRASFARAFGNTGIGRAFTNQLTNANLIRQSKISTDPGVVAARGRYQQSRLAGWLQSAEFKKNPISEKQAKAELIAAQKAANAAKDKAASDKLIADIQAKRIGNIQKEIDLLERTAGMSATEFEIESKIIEIKKEGAIQDEEAIRRKLEKLYKLKEERDLTAEIAEAWKSINQSIRNDITEGMKGLIKGTSTLSDVLNNVADKFLDIAINQGMYGNVAGQYSKGSGIFGMFGKMFSGMGGGGGGWKGIPYKLPGMAAGGPVTGGDPYVVGEKGPELFVPRSSGSIVPNSGMGGVTVNVDASGSSAEGDSETSKQLALMLGAAVQAELVRQKRPGGILA